MGCVRTVCAVQGGNAQNAELTAYGGADATADTGTSCELAVDCGGGGEAQESGECGESELHCEADLIVLR